MLSNTSILFYRTRENKPLGPFWDQMLVNDYTTAEQFTGLCVFKDVKCHKAPPLTDSLLHATSSVAWTCKLGMATVVIFKDLEEALGRL
jgi:hypothetical protein